MNGDAAVEQGLAITDALVKHAEARGFARAVEALTGASMIEAIHQGLHPDNSWPCRVGVTCRRRSSAERSLAALAVAARTLVEPKVVESARSESDSTTSGDLS